MFLENNIKRYDVGEHKKSVEGKQRKSEIFLYFSSVLHVAIIV